MICQRVQQYLCSFNNLISLHNLLQNSERKEYWLNERGSCLYVSVFFFSYRLFESRDYSLFHCNPQPLEYCLTHHRYSITVVCSSGIRTPVFGSLPSHLLAVWPSTKHVTPLSSRFPKCDLVEQEYYLRLLKELSERPRNTAKCSSEEIKQIIWRIYNLSIDQDV